MTTGMIKKKIQKENEWEKMLDGPTKWLNVKQVTETLKATRDLDAWKVMIAYA